MSERFLRPPQPLPSDETAPIVFLTGPIQGAPDWQTPLANEILARRDDLTVLSPRRETVGETSFDYNEQVGWERAGLRRAMSNGAIAFWLAAQDTLLSYPQGRAYAQTTKIEFGTVTGWREFRDFPIFLGIDPQYRGGSEKYFRYVCQEQNIPILNSLDGLLRTVAQQTPHS